VKPFVFISTGMQGGPVMRRAALCAFGGVLLMGVGGLIATIMVIVALFRMLFTDLAAGGRLLLTALLIGLLAQLFGTLLMRFGSLLMRRALGAASGPAGPERAAPRHGGVTIDGEVVERKDEEPPRREGGGGR
jgi:hypothetical protein